MRYLPIILIVLFESFFNSEIFGSDKYKIPVKEIKINKDTVINEFIKTLIENDSVQILEYKKERYEEMPEITDERVVYIDYRNNSSGKISMKNFNSSFAEELKEDFFEIVKTPINGPTIDNPLKELNKTYISLSKLKGRYILFQPDLYYRTIINDTSIVFRDLEGWFFCKYKNVQKVNDKYVLEFYNYNYYTFKIEIRIIDKKRNIQIWKMTRNQEGDISSFYNIVVPVENAFDYPVLNIMNTGGLDDVYDKFDDVDLERLFNN